MEFHELSRSDISAFAFAGKATITLESGETGARYTYQITKAENNNGKSDDLFFVGLLTGGSNDFSYSYIGIIRNGKFVTTAKSKMQSNSIPCKAIAFFIARLNNLPPALKVYHSCKCGRCGRTLTTPESIERGLGPECARMG